MDGADDDGAKLEGYTCWRMLKDMRQHKAGTLVLEIWWIWTRRPGSKIEIEKMDAGDTGAGAPSASTCTDAATAKRGLANYCFGTADCGCKVAKRCTHQYTGERNGSNMEHGVERKESE